MSNHDDSHGPIMEEFRAKMNALAGALDELFNGSERPKKNGFILLVFPFGENPSGQERINYISNGERSDCIATLKEFLANWEGRVVKSPEEKQ